ncbi:MAG TPA: hypothetical protein VLL54_21945 [Pyrinomonadaceae bacterium]|nr:hypothetical protein [Pyrinomonadaceae bacterium]
MSELFAKFEVNRDPRWPFVSKLLAGSLVLHVVLCICALYIPGVRDAFKLASLIEGTRFIDAPYNRTEITDEVQLVELTSEKFRYPDGYFAVEGATPAPTPLPFLAQVLNQKQNTSLFPSPTPSPIASPGASPLASPASSTGSSSSTSPAVAQSKVSPTPAPTPTMSAEQAQTELEKVAAANDLTLPEEATINKQAMKDFATYAKQLKDQGRLDLNQPFEIVIEAELDQDGKLKDPKFTKKAGDPNLVDLFGRMVAALNDSGFLVYLKPVDKDNPGSKVVFTIKQGESEVLATVESEASSIESAKVLAKGFNVALLIGAQSRAGKDEEALLRNTSAEQNGKKIVFNFTMPRQAVVDLIKKQLAASKPS